MHTQPLRTVTFLLSGMLSRNIQVATRFAFLAFFLLALVTPLVSAQLRVGNLTHVLPQCVTQCDAYDVMNTECNNVGVYEITYIYCECTPPNFQIIEDCFNCQSVNATQEAEMQELLDDIVNNCNNKLTSPDSTLSISSQQIVPSAGASSEAKTSNSARSKIVRPRLQSTGVIISVLVSFLGRWT
ncbi:hypothetical protein B0H11DRAFT_1976103 [Mycena galericulata]|nr:hypothetical protein B0H11DRAFT_1976103 [Mycena galericulata]